MDYSHIIMNFLNFNVEKERRERKLRGNELRRKYRERTVPTTNEDDTESKFRQYKNVCVQCNKVIVYYYLLGIPPSRKNNTKSYLLDNAEPIDRSYQSYSTSNTPEVERQVPRVSTRPNNTWEPPRNIFSDL